MTRSSQLDPHHFGALGQKSLGPRRSAAARVPVARVSVSGAVRMKHTSRILLVMSKAAAWFAIEKPARPNALRFREGALGHPRGSGARIHEIHRRSRERELLRNARTRSTQSAPLQEPSGGEDGDL